MTSGALFSEDRKHRYLLWRIWKQKTPSLLFIGLNPSTADDKMNDPTIRRLIKFAAGWGFGSLYCANLFTQVTPRPSDLIKVDNLAIEKSILSIQRSAEKCDTILFGWGSFKEAKMVSEQIVEMFPRAKCLGVNHDGSPKHPLYLKATVSLEPYGPELAKVRQSLKGVRVQTRALDRKSTIFTPR